jgi:hypothetical protein
MGVLVRTPVALGVRIHYVDYHELDERIENFPGFDRKDVLKPSMYNCCRKWEV